MFKVVLLTLAISTLCAETFDAIVEPKWRPEKSKSLVYLYRPATKDHIALKVKGNWLPGSKVQVTMHVKGMKVKVEEIKYVKN